MTDETTPEATDSTNEIGPEVPQGLTLMQLWAVNYETVLAFMAGNTLSKADLQQYRLKAADIALHLTSIQVRS